VDHEKGDAMSSSKRVTETTNLTEITDSRVVGGDNSVNLSANDSNVSVYATDHGAVAGGLSLGSEAVTAATRMAADTNKTTASLFAGALEFGGDALSMAAGAMSSANEQLADAYQQGNAGDQTQLKYAGFVVVGLAALAFAASKIK
jgi:hypothetical protein